jgi:hypothetical protein
LHRRRNAVNTVQPWKRALREDGEVRFIRAVRATPRDCQRLIDTLKGPLLFCWSPSKWLLRYENDVGLSYYHRNLSAREAHAEQAQVNLLNSNHPIPRYFLAILTYLEIVRPV